MDKLKELLNSKKPQGDTKKWVKQGDLEREKQLAHEQEKRELERQKEEKLKRKMEEQDAYYRELEKKQKKHAEGE
jgi:hypothetical protein